MKRLNQEIGKRISQTRRIRGITQEKLAEELDITTKHMSLVERGVSSLSLERLIELSSYFDCTLDFLILGTENNINVIPPSILRILTSHDEKEIDLLLEYLHLYERLRK